MCPANMAAASWRSGVLSEAIIKPAPPVGVSPSAAGPSGRNAVPTSKSADSRMPPREPVDWTIWLVAPAEKSSAGRSEEHTSELQSRGHLVCRLLLEKKKD